MRIFGCGFAFHVSTAQNGPLPKKKLKSQEPPAVQIPWQPSEIFCVLARQKKKFCFDNLSFSCHLGANHYNLPKLKFRTSNIAKRAILGMCVNSRFSSTTPHNFKQTLFQGEMIAFEWTCSCCGFGYHGSTAQNGPIPQKIEISGTVLDRNKISPLRAWWARPCWVGQVKFSRICSTTHRFWDIWLQSLTE